MNQLSPNLTGYLRSWYDTTAENKRTEKVVVELTFDQFVSLFDKRQLRSLQKSIDCNRLRYMQSVDNAFAYVATWKSYAARSSNVWSVETALVCSRSKSATVNLPGPGDKLRPDHCANISKSLSGRRLSDDHKANISESSQGSTKAPWSEERRARMSERRQREQATKRAAQL